MKKIISLMLALIMALSVMSCLSVSVAAEHKDYYECDVAYTVEDGTGFWFYAEESGLYEFTSCNNFDPKLTVEFENGDVIEYDDADFDNLNYEFSAIIELEAGEEIFCFIEDGEGYDVDFYITRYYEEVCADEEYEMDSGVTFKFIAPENGTYEFYSFDNDDPLLEVEYEDGTVKTYDDISDEDYEFNALLSLEEGEEILCTVYDSWAYVNFGIRAYGNAEADVEYTADAGYEFFFTAEEEGYYRFVSFDNVGDPFIEISYDGEEITFDDCCDEDYEFDGGLYLCEGDYIQAKIDDNDRDDYNECVVNFCIEYWADECPGHYETDEWYIGEDASVYSPGWMYTECALCGEYICVEDIPQLKPGTPKLSAISNTASGVKVTWGSVAGADSYIVYRKTYNAKTKAWSGWSKIATGVTSTSYVDKTAKTGTYYLYTVRATNEAGTGGYNTSGIKTYFLLTPTVSATNANAGVTVKWSKITGASGYIIYRKTGTNGWTKVATVKGAGTVSYTDKGAKAGVTYRYTVKAYYSSYTSSYVTNGFAVRRLTTPKLAKVVSAKNGITFTWGKVSGATGYMVYRKTGNGGWKKIATLKGTSTVKYLDKSAKKGVTYKYTVRAYYGTSTSYYNTKGLTIKDKY